MKKTKIVLELLTDTDVLQMVEKKYEVEYVMESIDMQQQIKISRKVWMFKRKIEKDFLSALIEKELKNGKKNIE